MGFFEIVKQRAKEKCPKLVFAEGNNETIIATAVKCSEDGICRPVLLGNPEIIKAQGYDLAGIEIIDMDETAEKAHAYALYYEEKNDFPAEAIEQMLSDPLNYACMMLSYGDADGMICGYLYPTAEVISAAQLLVGLAEGVTSASSYVFEEVPGFDGGEFGVLAMGDCSMVPQPDAEELASIAINTARSSAALTGWTPKVAMLSFSTKGSSKHKDIDKVLRALEIVKEKEPGLIIDGELQLDAAILPKTSLKKVKGENPLQGKANVLIFPDLDAGNIGCKLVQILAGANMYGAVMCGFAKPLSDLSRNMSVEDIYGMATIVAAQCADSI